MVVHRTNESLIGRANPFFYRSILETDSDELVDTSLDSYRPDPCESGII